MFNVTAPYLLLFSALLGGSSFYLGFNTGRKVRNTFSPTLTDRFDGVSSVEKKPLSTEPFPLDTLTALSSKEFACNTHVAFDRLSELHSRRLKLEQHFQRGEANRARTATVERKALSARAAETAYRSCVSSMMPELLKFWDEKKDHQLKQWSEKKERATETGITYELLEQTADEVELSM